MNNPLDAFQDLPDVVRIPLVTAIGCAVLYAVWRHRQKHKPKVCPSCGRGEPDEIGSHTYDGEKGHYRLYRCVGCKTMLVSDEGRALEVREHWVPGQVAQKPPRARARR